MEKSVLKLLKRSRSTNRRSIFVVLGNESFQKIPDLYKFVAREKSLRVNWFSSDSSDIRKVLWTSKANDNYDEKNENFEPKVTHVSFRDIQHASIQSSYFAVVEDLNNIRPSDLVKIVESVAGKGVLVLAFSKISEVDKFTLPRYCDLLKSKFMKRLFASFTNCSNCVILDDKLHVLLPPKSASENRNMIEEKDVPEPSSVLKSESKHAEIFDKLIKICNTRDQSNFLSQCLETLTKRSIHCTISASSPTGRGKSIVLGLAIAGAVVLKYSNIFISSLNSSKVKTIFKYLLKGLDALGFKEDEDYDLIQSVSPKLNNALLGLNIFRDHPQAVRFVYPGDVENKLEQAELVIIDEAAAMPLPLLKKLLGPYIILMTSSVEGCGASGKYLYDNMISEIRHSSSLKTNDKAVSLKSLFPTSETISWKEVTLSEPINYSSGDEVENWMNQALCLNSSVPPASGCPYPQSCRLFYICRETLFSYEPYAEKFLQQLMSLFFCAKRTISPDILLKIADDPNYHIFCLLPPIDSSKRGSSDILCAILVHTEKHVPWNIIYSATNQSSCIKECFNEWTHMEGDLDFLPMQGIHVIDIVTYPIYRKMGYGSRALQLMQDFYEGKLVPLDDKPYTYSCKSKTFATNDSQSWPPLLLQLSEVEPEEIDFILVSYFLTPDLLRFWKKNEFVPVYISGVKKGLVWSPAPDTHGKVSGLSSSAHIGQGSPNSGLLWMSMMPDHMTHPHDVSYNWNGVESPALEHLCFMMKGIRSEISTYMIESWRCFCEYFFMFLRSSDFPSELALNLLNCKIRRQLPKKVLTKEEVDIYVKPLWMKALEKYCQNLGDLHCIKHCIPTLAKLFFSHRFVDIEMPVAQQVILLAFGFQLKTIEDIASDLSLHSTQVHGLLNRTVRKLTAHLTSIIEKSVEKTIAVRDISMEPVSQSLEDELEEAAQKIKEKQKEDLKKFLEMDLSEYAIKGSEDDWEKALHGGRKTLVSIKSLRKAPEDAEFPTQEKNKSFKHKNKEKKRKR